MGLKTTYAAKVGFWVILAAFATFALMVYFEVITPVGKKDNTYDLVFHFPSIRGLSKGAKLKLNGNEIGLVEAMEISPLSGIDVQVTIYDRKFLIHENAEVLITKESLLGSSYIEVSEPTGGFYDRKGPEPDQFYMRIAHGSVGPEAWVHYIHGGENKVVGQVIDVQSSDSGLDDVLIKQLDSSITFDKTFSIVPGSKEVWEGGKMSKVTFIDVYPPLREDSYFQGSREAGPEDLIAHIDKVVIQTGDQMVVLNAEVLTILQQVENLLSELEGLIDKQAIEDLFDSVKIQIEKIGNNISVITGEVENLVTENSPRISATVENIEATSASIREIAEDPELRESIKSLAAKLDSLTAQMESILADIDEITGDPEVKREIKESIHSVHSTLETTSKTVEELQKKLNNVGNMEFSGQLKSRFYPEPDSFGTDIDLFVRIPESGMFYTIGIDQIGEEDLFNLQMGYDLNESMSARFGVKRSKVGIGMDYHMERFFIKSDLYDPNDIIFDLYGGYGLTDDVYLVVGGENLFEDDIFNLGVLVEF